MTDAERIAALEKQLAEERERTQTTAEDLAHAEKEAERWKLEAHQGSYCPFRERAEKAERDLAAAVLAEREALNEAESLILWLSMKPARDKYGSPWRRCIVCDRPSKEGYTDKQSHETACAILLYFEKRARSGNK